MPELDDIQQADPYDWGNFNVGNWDFPRDFSLIDPTSYPSPDYSDMGLEGNYDDNGWYQNDDGSWSSPDGDAIIFPDGSMIYQDANGQWQDTTSYQTGDLGDGYFRMPDGRIRLPDGTIYNAGNDPSGNIWSQIAGKLFGSYTQSPFRGSRGGNTGGMSPVDYINQMLGIGSRMIGNNMVDKSIGRDINSMFDRLEGMSSLSPQQRQDLAGLAMQRYGRDYLNPETMGSLMERFNDPSYQDLIDASSGGLQTLYNDPMSNPIMQAVADRSLEAIARKSASAGHLGSGNFQDNMQQGLMAALGGQFSNLAQPMNQSFSAATGAQAQRQGQAAQMINALNGANQTMWGGANQMIDNANAPMQAASNLAPMALQAQMLTNPTRANMADFGTDRAIRVVNGNNNGEFDWSGLINQGLSAIASNWNG